MAFRARARLAHPPLWRRHSHNRPALSVLANRFSQVKLCVSAFSTHRRADMQPSPLMMAALSSRSERPSVHWDFQTRHVHSSSPLLDPKSEESKRKLLVEISAKESKVEQSIKQLITSKLQEQKNPTYTFLVDKRSQDDHIRKKVVELSPWYTRLHTKKFWSGVWETVKHEAQHYKAGFQLLWADTKISWRLLRKSMSGGALTRRERRQFVRTASDLFRLVPFSVFIIVPGMEFVLPFAIKIFPGMLPSQFQDTNNREQGLKAQLKVKLEMAKFLQETVEEMAVKRKTKSTKEEDGLYSEFGLFLEKSRAQGFGSTKDLLRFAPLFKDDMTLDNIAYPQIKAMCRLLGVAPMGTTALMRFRLRMKLEEIHADDLEIEKEGMDMLSIPELQAACRERGMRAIGISKDGLRQRLQQWLDLSIKHNVPATLLLLSRVLYLPEKLPEFERLRAVLEGLPEELLAQVKVEMLEAEGHDVDAKVRLQIITAEEEKIRAEKEERDLETAKTEAEAKKKEEAALAQETADKEELVDTAPILAATDAAPAQALSAKMKESKKAPLTLEDCVDLALIISQLSGQKTVSKEYEQLKDDVQEHIEDVQELQATSADSLSVSPVSQRLSSRVEKMLHNVEASLDKVDKANMAELDLDRDGVISREELMIAMKQMKTRPNEAKMAAIADCLDADHDGKLRLDVLQQVLNLVAFEGVDVRADHLQALTELIEKVDSHQGKESMATQSVCIYGGKGALGSVCVTYFKERGFNTISVDLVANEEADGNVVLSTKQSLSEQNEKVVSDVQALIKGGKLKGVICVAGGWAGGNAASEELIRNTELMFKQSVWTSIICARLAALCLAPDGVICLTGAVPALGATAGMIGYGMAKAAVHQLVKSLAAEGSGLPEGGCAVAILPMTLDTPMNRKFMKGADTSSWTPLETVAKLIHGWVAEKAPASGSLAQIITQNSETTVLIE